MQRHAIRQGFRCEGPTTGAHGNLPAAAESTPPVVCGACATTSDDPGPSLQQRSGLDLDLDVSMASRARMRMWRGN